MVLFWLWLPRRGRWKAPVDSEIRGKMCEMLGMSALNGYQVEALEAVCLNKRDTLVCVPTGSRNSACFEVGLIRRSWTTSLAVSEQLSTASVIGQICIGLKSAPRDVTPRTDWLRRSGGAVAIRPRRSECMFIYVIDVFVSFYCSMEIDSRPILWRNPIYLGE